MLEIILHVQKTVGVLNRDNCSCANVVKTVQEFVD